MTYSLFLYAVEPVAGDLSASIIVDMLWQQNLIQSGQGSPPYAAGEQLMEFINYLGCSPTLAAGDVQASLLIHRFNRLTGLGGESVVALRYPGCGHLIEAPTALLSSPPELGEWNCSRCDNSGRVFDINWRKSAGFSNCFIEISGIFPREALPNDRFLELLSAFSETDWKWFYSRSSPELDL